MNSWRSAKPVSRRGAWALARMLALAVGLAGCTVEHYQILPDWTPDETTDITTEESSDVPGDDEVADVPGESEDRDVQDEEDDGAGPAACGESSDDGDLPCEPGLVCCESGDTDYCFELSSDPQHCGACDRACDSGLECLGGTCIDS